MNTNLAFVNWVIKEMDGRNWSRSELARQADVTPTAISDLLNLRRSPGIDLCNALAKAFNLPPEIVLRKAGLIPAEREETELDQLGQFLLRQLNSEYKQQAVEYLRFLKEAEEKEKYRIERENKPKPATSES